MQDRLGEFLTALADNIGADKFRAYNPDPADADLSGFGADVDRLYGYEGAALLYTGQTHPAPRLAQCPINLIQVALRPSGVARWRTP